jgi:hypothetical protein
MVFDDLISEEAILERVDAYSIYSFYIGAELEVGKAYCSPIRPTDDRVPSFALFEHKSVMLFKDHGLGLTGNVFTFVKTMFEYDTMSAVLNRINADFDLELVGGESYEKKEKAKILNGYKKKEEILSIKVASKKTPSYRFTEFWNQYGISKATLDYYNVTQVSIIYYEYADGVTKAFYPKTLCIAYPIYNEYKLYSPDGPKEEKFRTNYPLSYIEGFLQLKYQNDWCIITKSSKEVLFFREHFDWDTIAGKSENTIIVRFMMLKLLSKFKHIFIWLDNDVAGQRAQAKYLAEYPFLIPVYYDVPEKDPTDRYANSLHKNTVLNEIKSLIFSKLEEIKPKEFKLNGNIRERYCNK